MNTHVETQNTISVGDLTYFTGLEVFDGLSNVDISLSIHAIQNSMYERNPEKYGNFLDTLKKQGLLLTLMNVPQRQERLELFSSMYCAMRLLDDICDDDLVGELSADKTREVIRQAAGKKTEEQNYGLYDILIEKVLECAKKIGVEQEMQTSIDMIAKSLSFDYERSIDEEPLRNKQDLEENFDMMDILGTEYGTAIILGIDPEQSIDRLKELGIACRIGYNIKDFIDDVHKNRINIPSEELGDFRITQEDMNVVKEKRQEGKIHNFVELSEMDLPPSIISWLEKEVSRMQVLLQEFEIKYSVGGIIFGNHAIPALYKQNRMRRIFNNLLMRLVVIPKIYISDIEKSIGVK